MIFCPTDLGLGKCIGEMPMLHERTSFYKYYTSTTALAVLENGTTRWSAPKLFNDPFDLPSQMHYSFSGEEAAHALIDKLILMAYGDAPIVGDKNNQYIKLCEAFSLSHNKPPRKVFRKTLSKTIVEVSKKFSIFKEKNNLKLSRIRDECAIFCVTEAKDNLLMWAHYAENHTGCVVKLRCIEGADQFLHYAQKVKYVDSYPVILGLSAYVRKLLGQSTKELTPDELVDKFTLTKSKHWEYEQEWRVVSGLKDTEAGYDYWNLLENEIEEVYIGCKANANFVNKLLILLNNSYPNVSVFLAKNNMQNYSLSFEKYDKKKMIGK